MTTRSLILFDHEIRAALRGELRLVVRTVNPQPFGGDATYQGTNIHGQHLFYPVSEDESVYDMDNGLRACPLGVPGTRLVGKEAWRVGAWREPGFNIKSRFAVDYQASPEIVRTPWIEVDDDPCATKLRCDIYKELVGKGLMPPHTWEPGKGPLRWRSPATMPAWASRITLVNETVSVCRIKELTEGDALACGFEAFVPHVGDAWWAKDDLIKHWNARYAVKGLGWDTSPWCWKVAVKGVEK